MKAIVAVDQNWGIGYNGDLLFRISADLKRFKELTIGHTIIYGRKTLGTFRGKQPLDGRRNIILSLDGTFRVPGAEVCNRPEQVFALVNDPENAYVIGGTSVYTLFLPFCTTVYVTKVHANCRVDRFFENLDTNPDWLLSEQSEVMRENGQEYQFVEYKRKTQGEIEAA